MTEQERPCNFLEGIFVEENVRFVVGIALASSHPSTNVRKAIRDSLYQHGAHVQVQSNQGNPTLWRPTSKNDVVSADESIEPLNGRTLRQVVHDHASTDLPKIGPAVVQLYGTEESATIVVININHALFDAITMKVVLRDFGRALLQDNKGASDQQVEFASMRDWGDLLSDSLPSLSPNGPSFLPFSGFPLKASDILGPPGTDTSSSGDDIVVSLSDDTVQACQKRAREHSTTLTCLWMANLFYALAKMYSEKNPNSEACHLAISVLVDLRRTLASQQNVLQIQATVTVGRQVVLPNDTYSDTIVEWLWMVARESTDDMKRRIDRGEAHRQGICFSNGKMEQACPLEATVELSNHGIYTIPEATSIEVSQRYDGYQGCSIIVHSESHSGAMKGTASIGSDVDHGTAQNLMDRVRELFELVAS